ncbi:hypothetical protein [Thermogemmatispora sp.]|uniref:hypothetical protein n=1 Tax=Thermogemmatispora sp. TaxID=1968838 RepID=UPI001DB115DE|nr:hypothetical protein [Thermogemmatispora sp.]MBX5449708.1 hypothetical protein [Thermogemmatispora sp.]
MSRHFAYRLPPFALVRRQFHTPPRKRHAFSPCYWPLRPQLPRAAFRRGSVPQPDLPFSPFVHSLPLPLLPYFVGDQVQRQSISWPFLTNEKG